MKRFGGEDRRGGSRVEEEEEEKEVIQIELINLDIIGARDVQKTPRSSCQVIGNVNFNHHIKPPSPPLPSPPTSPPPTKETITIKQKNHTKNSKIGRKNSQLQQRQIRIAVISAILALLRDIVLENGRRFGIVPVETVEDGFDVFGPVGREVEGYAHGFLWVKWCVCGLLWWVIPNE